MTRPGYRMTEIGEIPEEWSLKPFDEVLQIRKRKNPGKLEKLYTISMELVPESGIYCGYRPLKENEVVPPTYCESGDILLPKITPSVENGKQGIVPIIPSGYAFATSEVYPLVTSDYLTNIFMFYLLKLRLFRKPLIDSMVGTTGRQRVPKDSLSSLSFPIPPLPEQQKIAGILSTANETIQMVNDQITQTEHLKKGVMQTLLTKGIGHTKFKMTEVGEIPEEWDVRELHQVAKPRKEIVKPSEFMLAHYVGLENISTGQLKISSNGDVSHLRSPKYKFNRGDLLYGKLRPYLDKVALADKDGVCSTDIIPIMSENVNSRFLAYVLHSYSFLNFVESTISGTNHPRTNWDQMSNFKIKYPPLVEQQKIAEILSTVDSKLDLLSKKKELLEKLKKGLMEDLLTGRVRVKFYASKGEN